MNDHDFEGVMRVYGHGSYLQHNRAIPNGVAGVVGYVKALTRRFPEYGYDVKRITASGDIVFVHSHKRCARLIAETSARASLSPICSG